MSYICPRCNEFVDGGDGKFADMCPCNIEFSRASGDAVCGDCGEVVRRHPDDDRFPWLTVLCSGRLVKT